MPPCPVYFPAPLSNLPVLLGVVGGVVDDVVWKDHGGEDRMATDETGSERVWGGSRIGRLYTIHVSEETSGSILQRIFGV